MTAARTGKRLRRSNGPAVRQVNFRLPAETWARLDAMASVRNHPQSRIVSDALTLLYDTMPPAERRLTDQILEHRRKPA